MIEKSESGISEILMATALLVIVGMVVSISALSARNQIKERIKLINQNEGFYAGEMAAISAYLKNLGGGLINIPPTPITNNDLNSGG